MGNKLSYTNSVTQNNSFMNYGHSVNLKKKLIYDPIINNDNVKNVILNIIDNLMFVDKTKLLGLSNNIGGLEAQIYFNKNIFGEIQKIKNVNNNKMEITKIIIRFLQKIDSVVKDKSKVEFCIALISHKASVPDKYNIVLINVGSVCGNIFRYDDNNDYIFSTFINNSELPDVSIHELSKFDKIVFSTNNVYNYYFRSKILNLMNTNIYNFKKINDNTASIEIDVQKKINDNTASISIDVQTRFGDVCKEITDNIRTKKEDSSLLMIMLGK